MIAHVSDKSRLAAALLCGFVGVFGVHRFYVGKIGTGLLMLCTGGGLGIWAVIDFIIIVTGGFRDIDGHPLLAWMPAQVEADEKMRDITGRVDRIDRQLTELQGVMIDMSEKLDHHQYGMVP